MSDEGTYSKEGFHQGGFSGGKCPYCGSNDIATGLKFNLNAEVGPLGLSYKAVAFFRGTEQLHADLCRACGTVVRTYVTNTKRNWVQKENQKTHL
jgi:uncharacterized OB-fold protein